MSGGALGSTSLYTDSRASLTEALGLRDGTQVGAIDEITRQIPAGSLGIA